MRQLTLELPWTASMGWTTDEKQFVVRLRQSPRRRSGVQSPRHLAGVWLVPIDVQMVSMLAVMPQPEAKTA
jgi:hypothetical protein